LRQRRMSACSMHTQLAIAKVVVASGAVAPEDRGAFAELT
jgi:hypothetical protein